MEKTLEQLDHIIARQTLGGGKPGDDSSDLGKLALIIKGLLQSKAPEKPAETPATPPAVVQTPA